MKPSPRTEKLPTSGNTKRLTLSERLLLFLSRDPGAPDYEAAIERRDLGNALSLVSRVFPDFESRISGKVILDFGCGSGYQSVAMVRSGASSVVGVDTNLETLAKARELVRTMRLDHKIELTDKLEQRLKGAFDVLISQNSFEHYADPAKSRFVP